jgi:hypothetical protein
MRNPVRQLSQKKNGGGKKLVQMEKDSPVVPLASKSFSMTTEKREFSKP